MNKCLLIVKGEGKHKVEYGKKGLEDMSFPLTWLMSTSSWYAWETIRARSMIRKFKKKRKN